MFCMYIGIQFLHEVNVIVELTKHSQSYPIRPLPFDQVELRLKEFVDRERKYLSTRNNEQLKRHLFEE